MPLRLFIETGAQGIVRNYGRAHRLSGNREGGRCYIFRDDTLRYDIDKGFIYNEFGRRAAVREGVFPIPGDETP